MSHRIIQLITLLWAFTSAFAQQTESDYRLTSAGTLSNNFVTTMAIDGYGYVWVGTESGLNRITGKWSTVIPTANHHSGQHISRLYYHAESDQMLIGLEDGLCVYDCKQRVMRKLGEAEGIMNYSINDIATASDGGVWLMYGSGRVQHLDCGTLKAHDQKLNEYHGNRCGMDDGTGHLYLGYSQQGMGIVNLSDGAITTYSHQADNATSLPGNNVRCIIKDNNGQIWVGTDHGLALFNPHDGTFTKVTRLNSDFDDNVYDIRQINNDELWIATDMGGVMTVSLEDVKPGAPLHYREKRVKSSSINVRNIIQDEFGNIWLGNHSTGVDFISAQRSMFKVITNPPVFDMVKDNDGRIWLGCENELSVWQDGRMQNRWAIQSMARREHSFPRCILTDKNGYVWLGMEDEGVIRFDPKNGRFQPIDLGLEASDVHAFAQDASGRIWIGTEFGVFSYANGTVTSETDITQITHRAPVTDFLWLSSEDMLVTTLGRGIYTINLRQQKSVELLTSGGLPSDKVNQVISDHERGVWLATAEGLVHVADPMRLKGITVYDRQNGLADNHVRALEQDHAGRIWVSTFSGISCLNRKSGRFVNYDYFDGRQMNGFAGGAVASLANGTICFGAISGICSFDPNDFNIPPKVSDVQIVSCEVYNPVGSDTKIQQLIPDKDGRIQTSHEQNTLRLTFSLRDYAQTGYEEYSYRMKGMDNKWYYIDDDQDVVFRGLRPGNYTFILRAKLKSQNWEDASLTQLDICINPPFWRTWWAYAFYILAIALWGWYILHSYKRKLELKSSLELERRESLQKQELNEDRLRFFTNITHELRTPLTLILGPLEDLAGESDLPQQSRRRVAMIQKSAERLRSLINEILEFRKTETQNRRLTVARGDIGLFIHEICLNYKELYNNPQVQFSDEIADNLPQVYFDSEIITSILSNFLSNAIKYTEKGYITTTVKTEGNMLKIAVADTGFGIAPEALPHVFERYYQAKGSHQASGTGIGLALVKSLALLHEAQVSVDSHEGKGSCFTLKLNIDNTYPNALHKEDNTPIPSIEREEKKKTVSSREESEESVDEAIPTLLIVEDNTDIRQYIADSFADDYQILQAENGEQGLQMARTHTPNIIVSDIMMPRMNGILMTQQLKNDIRTSHIPVILLTAKTTDEDKEEGYDSGADSYLTKPFTAKLLAKRIQNLLAAQRRLAEYITRNPSVKELPQPVAETSLLSRLDREFLDKLNGIIRDNIMSQDIDIPFLTERMAMSHSTFYRKVKALTGMTAKDYVRKMRLQHCYRLLESGDYNVSEAAMMTGFNQMAHFRETFKNEFGLLPSEVLKKNN